MTTTLRRSALLVLIALATVLGLTTGPAHATFDNNTTTTASIGTVTVAAPTAVTAQMTSCSNSRTQSVQVSWAAPPAGRDPVENRPAPAGVVPQRLGVVRRDVPGRDSVHVDAAARPFVGQRTRELR